jgi:hypothetical protein
MSYQPDENEAMNEVRNMCILDILPRLQLHLHPHSEIDLRSELEVLQYPVLLAIAKAVNPPEYTAPYYTGPL